MHHSLPSRVRSRVKGVVIIWNSQLNWLVIRGWKTHRSSMVILWKGFFQCPMRPLEVVLKRNMMKSKGQRLDCRISYPYGIQTIELEIIRLVFLSKFAHLSVKNLRRLRFFSIFFCFTSWNRGTPNIVSLRISDLVSKRLKQTQIFIFSPNKQFSVWSGKEELS